MSEQDVETVRGAYGAFNSGNPDGVLERLAAEIEWVEPAGGRDRRATSLLCIPLWRRGVSLVDQLLRDERLGAGVGAQQARLDDDPVAVPNVGQVLAPVGVVVVDDDLGPGEDEAHRRATD